MLASLALVAILGQGLDAPKAETSLISNYSTVQPGVPFTVALKVKMPDNWHTYYLNPGDAGQATEIHWKLPAGFKAGPIQWPVPHREDFQGIASYVYENEAYLLSTVTPPKTWKAGTPVHLAAHVTWLLCSTGCVPQSSDLTLDLASGAAAVSNADAADQFATAWKAMPVASEKVKASASAAGKAVIVNLTMPIGESTKATFIPADVDSFGANQPIVTVRGGILIMNLALTPYAKKAPARLKGILVTDSHAYTLDVPVKA